MASTTASAAAILTPEQVAGLIIKPLLSTSIAGQILTGDGPPWLPPPGPG
jgi:hypothetical protein